MDMQSQIHRRHRAHTAGYVRKQRVFYIRFANCREHMIGYQRAKLTNFGDVIDVDCKQSGIKTLEWPKPITAVLDQEGKLCKTCTGTIGTENGDM